jgi:hypothetical protein
MDVFVFESLVQVAVFFVLLAVKIFAFVSALLYSAEAYLAADKLNKPTWCIFLGLAVLLQVLLPTILLLSVALTIAALVYLADVRPALAGLRRR